MRERRTAARLLLRLSGASGSAYVASNAVHDVTLHCATTALSVAFLAAVRVPGLSAPRELRPAALILFVFGTGSLGWAYAGSHWFRTPERAQSFLVGGATVATLIVFGIYVLIDIGLEMYRGDGQFDEGALVNLQRWLQGIGTIIFPLIGLCTGLYGVGRRGMACRAARLAYASAAEVSLKEAADAFACPSLWVWDAAVGPVVLISVSGAFYMLWAVLAENSLGKPLRRLWWIRGASDGRWGGESAEDDPRARTPVGAQQLLPLPAEDAAVAAERGIAEAGGTAGGVLLSNRLGKWYKGRKRPALAALSLEVRQGEAFGLLGPNGAGKSTLLSLVAGEMRPSAGSVHLRGAMRGAPPATVVGLCPQSSAQNDFLTPREAIAVFAELKGVPARDIPAATAYLLDACGIPLDAAVTVRRGGADKYVTVTAVSDAGAENVSRRADGLCLSRAPVCCSASTLRSPSGRSPGERSGSCQSRLRWSAAPRCSCWTSRARASTRSRGGVCGARWRRRRRGAGGRWCSRRTSWKRRRRCAQGVSEMR